MADSIDETVWRNWNYFKLWKVRRVCRIWTNIEYGNLQRIGGFKMERHKNSAIVCNSRVWNSTEFDVSSYYLESLQVLQNLRSLESEKTGSSVKNLEFGETRHSTTWGLDHKKFGEFSWLADFSIVIETWRDWGVWNIDF